MPIFSLISVAYQLLRTARPRQWLKNVSVFAAPVFSGVLFTNDVLWPAVRAFFAFCAISSFAYIINDVIDAPKDRQHPVKKNRPIASGKLTPQKAIVFAIVLLISTLTFSYLYIGTYFSITLIMYVFLQFAYSLYFRNVIILDSLVVATGFIIRVFAGGFASNTSISSWLALTTIGISLLLAFGKRRSEKTLLARYSSNGVPKTRATLRHYPDNLLDSMISMSATYTIITYSLFTFQVSPQTTTEALYSVLPSILRSPKWMMLTIPVVIYGVARYLYLIYERKEGESPARVLLSDMPLLLTVLAWGAFVLFVYYALPLLG